MWDKIKKSQSKTIFVDCCVLIGEILIKFHSDELQDKFFEEVFDIFKSTISSTSSEAQAYYHKFEIFLYSILTKINNYSNILNVDNFLYLLENFNVDIKLNICHTILAQIIDSNDKIKDVYLAFSLLKIGKFIHDSVEVFSPESKRKEISNLLSLFIRKVDFGIDFENWLNFLTEARGMYSDLDDVIELLICEVARICILTYKMVKGKHNKKTLRFCKVCIAYCQITIPSLKSLQVQLKHLLWTAQIALTNNLISECDSLVKNWISVLAKLLNEKYDTDVIISAIKNLTSFLVIVPSNPESPFQLVTGLMNVFSTFENFSNSRMRINLTVLLNLVKYLSTQLQIKLPYHVLNVDSNDEIFVKDENFRNEGQGLLESIINDILAGISDYDSKLNPYDYDDYDFLFNFCLECAESFFSLFDIDSSKFSRSVVNKMKELAQKYLENIKKNRSLGKEKLSSLSNYLNKV